MFIVYLKVDNDVVVLVAGILIITSLLPSIPSLVGSFLEDFFEIFERVFLFTARKRGELQIIVNQIQLLFFVK